MTGSRTMGVMTTIDRYVFAQAMARFAILLAIVMFALLMQRLIRVLDLLVTKNASISDAVWLMINLVPHYLNLALVAAFFISVLLALIRLRENSELDVLFAGGVSLLQVAKPILALAALLTLVTALLIGFLQPHARYAYRNLLHTTGYDSWYNTLESGGFLTGFGGMTLRVDDIGDQGRKLEGIFIHKRTQDGRLTTITAESGAFEKAGDERLILTLENATQVRGGNPESQPVVIRTKRFTQEIATLFTPPPFRSRGKDERELTLPELWESRNDPPPDVTRAAMSADLHSRIVRIASVPVLPLLAVALGAMAPKRRQGATLGVGLFLLIAYNEILQFGGNLVEDEEMPAWLTLYLPFVLLILISAWLFVRATKPSMMRPADIIKRLMALTTMRFSDSR